MGASRYVAFVFAAATVMCAEAWAADDRRTVLASGDEIEGLGRVTVHGYYNNPACLAADGRLAAVAESEGGESGIVCVDAEGPHLIVKRGDPAPDGLTFTGFSSCSFADDGGLIFGGYRAVPDLHSGLVAQESVYRADSFGFSKLFGDGDPVTNHTIIDDPGSGVQFVANARGSVLARTSSGGNTGLFLARHNEIELVTLDPGVPWWLSDRDEVVMLGSTFGWSPPLGWPENSGNELFVWSEGRLRVALRSDDPALRGSLAHRFHSVHVNGDLIVFRYAGQNEDVGRLYSYRISDGSLSALPIAAGTIRDISPNGNLLESFDGGYAVISPSGERNIVSPHGPTLAAFAVNDRGNVAFNSFSDSTGQVFQLAGPALEPSALCPRPDSNEPNPPTPAPTATPAPFIGTGPSRAYVLERFADRLTAIDTSTQEILGTAPTSRDPSTLAASPDGSRVFVSAGPRVDIFEAATLRLIHSIGISDFVDYFAPLADNISTLAFASVDGSGARIARIDGSAGTTSSILSDAIGHVIGRNSDTTALAVVFQGSVHESHSLLTEIDLDSGAALRQFDIGGSVRTGTIDGRQAYLLDNWDHRLRILDADSLEALATVPFRDLAHAVAIGPNHRAYVAYNWEGREQLPGKPPEEWHGGMSVIDLLTGSERLVRVPGGQIDSIAATPDGDAVYVSARDNVVVLDATTLEVRKRITVNRGGAIAIGPVPPAVTPTPATATPRVVVRAHGALGIPNDDLEITVALEGDDLSVNTLEHTLLSTWTAPVTAWLKRVPECHVTNDVAATATFAFAPSCQPFACDRVQVRLQAELGTSLPLGRPLFSCSVHTAYYTQGTSPLLVLNPSAKAAGGEPLPVVGVDGEITVIDRDHGTPHPTPPRPSTYTPTVTPTRTPTPLPVMITIGATSFAAGGRGSIDAVLTTNGMKVAGVQNDILFSAEAPIAARASGAPACSVNPEIDKPDSNFVFHPIGCDAAAGECTSVRALVVSIDQVDEIPDGSVLYTCSVTASAPGVFGLVGSRPVVAALDGRSLPVEISDGTLTVEERPTPESTPTAVPQEQTDTPLPPPTETPKEIDTPPDTPASSDVAQGVSRSSGGSGCSIEREDDAGGALYVVLGMLVLGYRARKRTLS